MTENEDEEEAAVVDPMEVGHLYLHLAKATANAVFRIAMYGPPDEQEAEEEVTLDDIGSWQSGIGMGLILAGVARQLDLPASAPGMEKRLPEGPRAFVDQQSAKGDAVRVGMMLDVAMDGVADVVATSVRTWLKRAEQGLNLDDESGDE